MKSRILFSLIFVAIATSSPAALISQWTFEVNTPPDLSNSAASPTAAADVGNGTASGLHASAATDWSTPAGNGSVNSFSANNWAIGDYFQFQLNTTNFDDITVGWDQTRSATGPATFDFAYSLDGSTFTTALDNYTVLSATWSSGSPLTTTSFAVDLSAVSALDNAPSVFFRLTADAAVTNPDGTSRVDNFTVNGTARATVPDSLPFGFVVATFAGLLAVGSMVGNRRVTEG